MPAAQSWVGGIFARSLRLLATGVLLGGLAVVPVRDAAAAPDAWVDPDLSAAVAGEINGVRADEALRQLRVSTQLARAARQHALSMGRLGYFSHSSANGTSPLRRIASFYPSGGWIRWAVGEVLLWSSGDISATTVVERWLESSGHHHQLMNARWREFGVAAVRVADGPGIFGGRDGVIVVVDFGSRS